MSRVAVVILNYNGENLLRQFLPSVIRHSIGASIYVADNGSTDQSEQVLKNEFPGVQIIRLPENYGFCGGYNRALNEVDADFYILLNSDVEVTERWITPMQDLLEKDPTIAAVQPKILSYSNRNQFEYAGAAGGFIDSFGYPFCRGRIFESVEQDLQQYNDTRPIFWASGACLMIRSEVYHRFGGLDEDFFAHMEEIDLCWKIHRAGLKVYYCGQSTVYHLGAGTLGYSSPRKTYLNFRNNLSLITKHFSTAEMLWKFPMRVSMDWLAALMFLAKRQPLHAKAIVAAHRSYLRHLRTNLQKRKILQSAYPRYSRETIYKGLSLLEYYLKRKKKLL